MKNRLALAICSLVAVSLATTFGLAQERRQIPEIRTFGAPASAEDADALAAALEAYKAAWGAEDTAALMALHAEDTEWINAYARIFRGTDALSAFLEERLFPEFSPETSRREAENMTLISTRYVGDDAAVVHLYTESSRGPSVTVEQELRRTHLHLVWAKRDENWKIVHTAIMDAR